MSAPFIISRDDCVYTTCYCEENIWKLCDLIRNKDPTSIENYHVVFISNDSKKIPMWKQRAGDPNQDGLVVWDYHVILVYCHEENCLIYDFDTVLEFPCIFDEYTAMAIKSDDNLNPQYYRKFRVINAKSFLLNFSSDRSHMMKENGSWMMPPPLYPCIQSPNTANNLELYISMNDDSDLYGRVINVSDFSNKVSK